jgi:hypothetical protein
MSETIQVTAEITKPPGYFPDHCQIVYREANLGDLCFFNPHWGVWEVDKPSNSKYFIAQNVGYREPVLPRDWGLNVEFSRDGKTWEPGTLAAYYKDEESHEEFWSETSGRYFRYCRIAVVEAVETPVAGEENVTQGVKVEETKPVVEDTPVVPEDLYQHVARYAAIPLVWSRRGNLHQVRYGLQTQQFQDSLEAAEEFGRCVHYHAEGEGLITDDGSHN